MRKWITIGAAFAAALTAFVGGGAPAQAQAWQELTQKELATVSSIDLARKVLKSETIEDLRRASVNGDARATWLLGYSYKQGLGGVTKDLRQSYILSREACQMGSPRGCDALAFNLVAGNGTDKNVVEAARLFESVCDRGIASSCERLATVYYRGEGGIPKTLGRALFFRKRGCEIGSMYNCHLVGQMYSKGEGTEADPERAQAFNARSCDGGYGRGCFYAGRIIERAASRNDPAAFSSIARYYEKGCALEQKDSCYNRGIIDNEGKFGRPRSTIAAVPWMEKACKFRSNDACYNLGSWLINGRAGRTDGKRAIELLGPLC
ncbi:MAG: tetratricopeptide repeat protein, partial [Pseudomonadota bacterium]|nr:tetratricopeptide repeat protein [Pseudomonadota bacterium]